MEAKLDASPLSRGPAFYLNCSTVILSSPQGTDKMLNPVSRQGTNWNGITSLTCYKPKSKTMQRYPGRATIKDRSLLQHQEEEQYLVKRETTKRKASTKSSPCEVICNAR